MSTIFAALMCYLRDPQAFLAANRTLTSEAYQHRFCKGQNEFGSVKALLNGTGTREKDWHFLALVRDPLERFLSGYIDKCINEANMTSPFRRIVCYNCSLDLACFVRRQFRRAQIFASNGGRSRLYWTFEDFHFFPQNWYCQFHSHFAHFKLFHFGEKQEERTKMQSELIEWLRSEGNVPEELLLGIREKLVQQTGHSTREDPQREGIKRKLLGDKEMRRTLARMFYMDYALFGLPFGELFV